MGARVKVTPDTAPVANSTRGVYDMTDTNGNPTNGVSIHNNSGASIYVAFYDDSTQVPHADAPDAGTTYGSDLELADGEKFVGPLSEIIGPYRQTCGHLKLFAATGATVASIIVMKDDS